MEFAEIDEVRTQLTPTLRKLGVEKAIVFGSISRGTKSRRSDIDILLYTPSELKRIAHRPFIRKILAEGKTIYEH